MTEPGNAVQRYFAAFGASDIDAAMACVHSDAIWHVDGDPAVGTVGIIRGREAVRRWLKRFPDSFRPLAFSVERMIADGADVIALGRFRHRVVPTRAIVDSDFAIRFTIRDGLIARYQIFEDSFLIGRALADGTASRSAAINGTVYGWDDVGQGPPVLFLHGLFLDRSFWAKQVRALSDTRRCVTLDMPGHGASGWRDGLDLDGIAEDIALWIIEHGAERATIVGHSQGGMIAMRIAARHPALVERLVLVNTSARAEYPDRLDTWRERRAELLAGEAERASAFSTVQNLTTASSWLAEHPVEVAAEHATMMRHDPDLLARALDAAVLERADIRSLLASIEADAIVLSGGLDEATPSELGEEIAAALPRARHEVVPDAAHHLPAEAAATMNRAIDGTLGHEACASR
ncbi:alpha/beta fold hydrolase [Inquilinus sp. CAU 1745]|uniref:alpha/beta fold hydrolase n=1 Tax=Inquilinus sp. CAU 1745 TaxID=3140369 RepID=UPI00325B973E